MTNDCTDAVCVQRVSWNVHSCCWEPTGNRVHHVNHTCKRGEKTRDSTGQDRLGFSFLLFKTLSSPQHWISSIRKSAVRKSWPLKFAYWHWWLNRGCKSVIFSHDINCLFHSLSCKIHQDVYWSLSLMIHMINSLQKQQAICFIADTKSIHQLIVAALIL